MKKLFLFLACSSTIAFAQAQSVGPSTINAAGGSAQVGGNTHEWSIGEMAVVSTYASSSLVVTQGVLQPGLVPSGISTTAHAIKGLTVYPNPVTDGQLFLRPAFSRPGTLTYTLFDAAGRKVLTQDSHLTTGNELQTIPMAGFASGQYTLSVQWQQGNTQLTDAYQIQKTR